MAIDWAVLTEVQGVLDISDQDRTSLWKVCWSLDLGKALGFDAWEHYISLAPALLGWSLLDLTLTEHARHCTKLDRQAGPVSKISPVIQERGRMQ